MELSKRELDLLNRLIGRKAERIIVPTPYGSLTKPVETVIVLARGKGLLIDSCYRMQKPVETPKNYPQMRVRMIDEIPDYPNGESIELSEDGGEIIASIEVTTENIRSSTENASYTKTLHIEFSGKREVTITRETYRTPSLQVYEKTPQSSYNFEPNAQITQTIHTF